MTQTTIKGRASGWPGIVVAFEESGRYQCPTCGQTEDNPHAMFDHVAWRHPLLVKGESAQR